MESEDSTYKYVIADKDDIRKCITNAKFIIKDSIEKSPTIKLGSKFSYVGFNAVVISGVRIKEAGYLAKTISNCNAMEK